MSKMDIMLVRIDKDDMSLGYFKICLESDGKVFVDNPSFSFAFFVSMLTDISASIIPFCKSASQEELHMIIKIS